MSLSVDAPSQVWVLGTAATFAYCKATTKVTAWAAVWLMPTVASPHPALTIAYNLLQHREEWA